MVDVTDWNDLDAVRNDLTADYVLKNDLDSSTAGYSGIGDDFKRLGDRNTPFVGSFDGGGYSIQNLQITDDSATGTRGVGLFGAFDNASGTIKNLAVTGSLTTSVSRFGQSRAGGLVGEVIAGTIRDCAIGVDVTANSYAAGITAINAGAIERTYALGSVTGNGSGDQHLAAGVGNNAGSITDAYATGAVTVDSADATHGGFIGEVNGGSDTGCYWDTVTTGRSDSAGSATGLTTADMQGDAASNNMSALDFTADFDEVIALTAPEVNGDVPDSDGYPVLSGGDVSAQLAGQGIALVEPKPGIVVDGAEYPLLVDGVRYSAVRD